MIFSSGQLWFLWTTHLCHRYVYNTVCYRLQAATLKLVTLELTPDDVREPDLSDAGLSSFSGTMKYLGIRTCMRNLLHNVPGKKSSEECSEWHSEVQVLRNQQGIEEPFTFLEGLWFSGRHLQHAMQGLLLLCEWRVTQNHVRLHACTKTT